MLISDLQYFFGSLGQLVTACHGNKGSVQEIMLLKEGLEPFRDMELQTFVSFLKDAAEYKRTGSVPLSSPAKKRAASKPSSAPRQALRTITDVDAIASAVAVLEDLEHRAPDPALTFDEIRSQIKSIHDAFDKHGFIEIARRFEVRTGLTSKATAMKKIEEKISKRKGRVELANTIEQGYSSDNVPQPTPEEIPEATLAPTDR